MLQAAYSGAAGARAMQEKVNVIAHNVANMNTYGFKSSNITFKDTLYGVMTRPIQPQDHLNLQQGTGVIVAGTPTNFRQGTLNPTGVTMDFAIDGEGFFTVINNEGRIQYTRAGNFGVSVQGDGTYYLRNGDGFYVLDENNERIQLQDPNNLYVDSAGRLSAGPGEPPYATMGIKTFDNLEGLIAVGNSSFVPSVTSGAPTQAPQEEYSLMQGYLESSNVNYAAEVTKLIMAQRTLSLAAQAITTADEMEATTNNLRA
ncbi:flagellar hook-basal body protein [Eubacteriales bacterium OttesenSCG-928-N14]|nr:flagellar hook-basal body protein [Eubacteriales bacterium OttesenSCG-928-N14]